MSRPVRPKPRDVLDVWPSGRDGSVEGNVAGRFAENLASAVEGRSLREVEKLTGVDHSTLAAIAAGRTWPDMSTIARLEAGLGCDLWPVGVARRQGQSHGHGASAE